MSTARKNRLLGRRPLNLQGSRPSEVDPLRAARVAVLRESDEKLLFELSGVGAMFANELRKTLMDDVPALAIDAVEVRANTSVVDDEVICQRLGLIPVQANPTLYEDGELVVFELRVRCEEESLPRPALAGDLKWREEKDQEPASVAHPNIVIVELAPGQELDCLCYARKGSGREHAKFSPVGTATYRYVPQIRLRQPVEGKLAQQLADVCPRGVFVVRDGKAEVGDPLLCTDCLQCTKATEGAEKVEWADYVEIGKAKDRFEFAIESAGSRTARELYEDAVRLMIERRRPPEETPVK